ncbi:von Hippel-Lindau disease tumor suppressor-like [Gigantopelta aegis]|uniref:von Hippel-Lindau disease tumor suppressor-like n=1 Tax=Gigantopelta aegis TaxID=1735272 RepID=UPI001B88CDC6|nr:von Hippel-Lindau disease tumor suppressor-like [Gigantopelta aegis]
MTAVADASDAHGQKWMKSGRSVVYSFVRFVNCTKRRVDIIWLNYEGARVKYRTLQPHQFVDANTFVGHPWVFRDADTGDRLMVQLREVYEPVGWSSSDGWPPQRKVVNISIPVYSLKQRCIQVVRSFVNHNSVSLLDLPVSLKVDLKNAFNSACSNTDS